MRYLRRYGGARISSARIRHGVRGACGDTGAPVFRRREYGTASAVRRPSGRPQSSGRFLDILVILVILVILDN